MIISSSFELVDVAGECLAVPVGKNAEKKEIFVFSKAAGFLIKMLKEPRSKQELVQYLVSEYSLDQSTALVDIEAFISTLVDYGVVIL